MGNAGSASSPASALAALASQAIRKASFGGSPAANTANSAQVTPKASARPLSPSMPGSGLHLSATVSRKRPLPAPAAASPFGVPAKRSIMAHLGRGRRGGGGGAGGGRPAADPAGAAGAADQRYLDLLTADQRGAVTSPWTEPLLIKAAAGSGKTLVLTSRILHMIQHGVPPGEILALTFSRKAAHELEERVRGVLRNDQRASELTVSTFHALALRLLRAHPRLGPASAGPRGVRGLARCRACGCPAAVEDQDALVAPGRVPVARAGGGSGAPPRILVVDAEKRRDALRRCAAGFLFTRPAAAARPFVAPPAAQAARGALERLGPAGSGSGGVGGRDTGETAVQLLEEWGEAPPSPPPPPQQGWPQRGDAGGGDAVGGGEGAPGAAPRLLATPFGPVPPAVVHSVQTEVVQRLEALVGENLRAEAAGAGRGLGLLERHVLDAYDAVIDTLGAVDLASFVPRALAMLQSHCETLDAVRRRYRYLVCDEFQDVNHCQLTLVQVLVGPDARVTVCGDDDQAIYGWRGGTPRALGQFRALFPRCRVAALSENFRSSATIVEAAQCVIRKNAGREEKEVRAVQGQGPQLELLVSSNPDSEGLRIADVILRHYRAGDWRLGDVAVLARTRAVRDSVNRRLRRTGIRSVVAGRSLSASSPYAWSEVRDALAWMVLACRDTAREDEAFRRVCNVPPRGMTPHVVAALERARAEMARSREGGGGGGGGGGGARRGGASNALAALEAAASGRGPAPAAWTLLRVARAAVLRWGLADGGEVLREERGRDAVAMGGAGGAVASLGSLTDRQRMAVAGFVDVVDALAAACRTQGPEDMVRFVMARTGAEEMMERRAEQDASRARKGGTQPSSRPRSEGGRDAAASAGLVASSVEQRRHALCLLMEDARRYAERLARGAADRLQGGGGGGGKGEGAAASRVGPGHLRAFLREARAIAEQESVGWSASSSPARRNGAGEAGSKAPTAPLTRDADCVTLSTIHQAKGLEWDVVIVARFNDGVIPLPARDDDDGEELEALDLEADAAARSGAAALGPAAAVPGRGAGAGAVAAAAGPSRARAHAELATGTRGGGGGGGGGAGAPTAAEQLAEERRLFYVAMTRSRQTLYLSFCQFLEGGRVAEPSPFLHDIPARLVAGQGDAAPTPSKRVVAAQRDAEARLREDGIPAAARAQVSADRFRTPRKRERAAPGAAGESPSAATCGARPSPPGSVVSTGTTAVRGGLSRRMARGGFRAPRRLGGAREGDGSAARVAGGGAAPPPAALRHRASPSAVAHGGSGPSLAASAEEGGGAASAMAARVAPPRKRSGCSGQNGVGHAAAPSPRPPPGPPPRPPPPGPDAGRGAADFEGGGCGLFSQDLVGALRAGPRDGALRGEERAGGGGRGEVGERGALVKPFAERCECPCHGPAAPAWSRAAAVRWFGGGGGGTRRSPRKRARAEGEGSRPPRVAAKRAMASLSAGVSVGRALGYATSDSSLLGGTGGAGAASDKDGWGPCTPSEGEPAFEGVAGDAASPRSAASSLPAGEVALGWTLSGRALCRACAYRECADDGCRPL